MIEIEGDEVGHMVATVRVVNPDGTSAEGRLHVETVDDVPPELTMLAPLDGAVIPYGVKTVTLRGTADDNVRVSRVETSVDGDRWLTAVGTERWAASMGVGAGVIHKVRVRAFDDAGNVTEIERTVEGGTPPDTMTPTIKIVGPYEVPAGTQVLPVEFEAPPWATVYKTVPTGFADGDRLLVSACAEGPDGAMSDATQLVVHVGMPPFVPAICTTVGVGGRTEIDVHKLGDNVHPDARVEIIKQGSGTAVVE